MGKKMTPFYRVTIFVGCLLVAGAAFAQAPDAANVPSLGIDADIVAGLDPDQLLAQGLTPCQVLITVEDGTGTPGELGRSVQIELQSNVALTELDFEIHDLPDFITVTGCSSFVDGFSCCVTESGVASVEFTSPSSLAGPGAGFNIMELYYAVDPGAPAGPINLTPMLISAIDDDLDACSAAGMPGSFAVSICGDGVVEGLEECDDGNTLDGDCCSAGCTMDPYGTACEDGDFCTVNEVCSGLGVCEGGFPRDCDDGISCTTDSCDEVGDTCSNAPVDAVCDNGLICDGPEVCSPVSGCGPGTPPDCDDGIACTDDYCIDPVGCSQAPIDLLCANASFCDGMETCEPGIGCQPGPPPCGPGETCSEQLDQCL